MWLNEPTAKVPFFSPFLMKLKQFHFFPRFLYIDLTTYTTALVLFDKQEVSFVLKAQILWIMGE